MSRSSSALLSTFVLLLTGCLGGSGPVDPGDAGPRCTTDEDCDDEIFCNGLELCAPDEEGALANGCLVGTPPCGEQPCLEETDTCELECPDGDGDGQEDAACGGTDCDDSDRNVFLGATEVCDQAGIDDDCDPTTLGIDADEDGFPSTRCCNGPPGGLRCGEDCDDGRASANPDAPEVCNGLDDDCDGSLDEGVTISFYRDADGDSYGDVTVTMEACSPPTGWTILSGDCNDANPNISPGRPESCLVRGADDDCDGNIDEICDCSPADPPITCGPGAPEAGRGVCRDGTQVCSSAGTYGDCMGGVYPGEETCDGLDEDCDGRVDEGGGRACPQNASVSGTTACGRAGVRRCGADCQWLDSAYLAAGETVESCDYCADTAGGLAAEQPFLDPGELYTQSVDRWCIGGCQRTTRIVRGDAVPGGPSVNDASAWPEAGSIWTDSYAVPYGEIVLEVALLSSLLSGSSGAGSGFNVSLVSALEPSEGPFSRFGMPVGGEGFRLEWRRTSASTSRVSIVREPDGRVIVFQDISASMFDVRTSETSAIHLINMRVVPDDPNTVNDETEVSISIRYGGQIGNMIFEYACDNTITTACPARFEPGDQVRGVLATGGEGALRRVAHQSTGGFDVYLRSLCPLL